MSIKRVEWTDRGFMVALVLWIGLVAFVGFVLMSGNAKADDSSVSTLNISVPVACSLIGTTNTAHTAEIPNGVDSRSSGYYPDGIGQTTLKAYCNDSEGFSIYAIGYTGEAEGNTYLRDATLGSSYDIQTGTTFSGLNSNWAMKIGVTNGTYPSIVAGSTADSQKQSGDPDYSTWQSIPSTYTRVAYRTAATDVNNESLASAEGSSITTTYAAYISTTQNSGTYVGKVKYVLVHPNDADPPLGPNQVRVVFHGNGHTFAGGATEHKVVYEYLGSTFSPVSGTYAYPSGSSHSGWYTVKNGALDSINNNSESSLVSYLNQNSSALLGTTTHFYAINPFTINYDDNGATAGAMSGYHTIINMNLPVVTEYLLAPNCEKSGYGFAGWSEDSNATVNGASKIYGPNERITGDELTFNTITHEATLYAVWVQAESGVTMQTFNSASQPYASYPIGRVIALSDARDGNTYAVAKMADGLWWTMENLRLDVETADITASNTNNPTATFLQEIQSASSTSTWCNDNLDATCTDQVVYNTSSINRNLTPSSSEQWDENWENLVDASWFSYGVYYNWYTATAGNGTLAFSAESGVTVEISGENYTYVPRAAGDICPSGWRMPTDFNDTYRLQDQSALPDPGSFGYLKAALGGIDIYTTPMLYPLNYVFSGEYYGERGGQNMFGYVWTSSAMYEGDSYAVHYGSMASGSFETSGLLDEGFVVRCVAD